MGQGKSFILFFPSVPQDGDTRKHNSPYSPVRFRFKRFIQPEGWMPFTAWLHFEPSVAILQATQDGTPAPKATGMLPHQRLRQSGQSKIQKGLPKKPPSTGKPRHSQLPLPRANTKWPETGAVLTVSWCYSNRNEPERRSHTGKGDSSLTLSLVLNTRGFQVRGERERGEQEQAASRPPQDAAGQRWSLCYVEGSRWDESLPLH